MALYEEVAPFVEEHYWEMSSAEMAEACDCGTSTIQRAGNHAGLPKKTERNRVVHTHGVPLERVLYHLHHDAMMSVNEMSDALAVSRKTLDRWFADTGIYKRGQSEAARVKWQQMSEAERKEQVRAAHEAHFEKHGDSGYIAAWVEENPDEHQRVARENAHLGAAARERNGMAGATGQDNPNWRGGKSIYDAVKKQLPGDAWRQLKMEAKRQDGHYCQACGATGCKLDSHHIVPIMAGGTNGFWNLMTLCESCHRKAEAFVRQYSEFDPVLVE